MFFSIVGVSPIETRAACGRFEAWGQVRNIEGSIRLILAEGSLSQQDIIVSRADRIRVNAFLGKTVLATINITKAWSGNVAQAASVESIKLMLPDPLGLTQRSSLKLLKETRCDQTK